MLRNEDLRLDVGRCDGGTFLHLVHVPTGIFRIRAPMGGANRWRLIKTWRAEIEAELISRGLGHYVLNVRSDDPV